MKKSFTTRLLALLLCVATLATVTPLFAVAENTVLTEVAINHVAAPIDGHSFSCDFSIDTPGVVTARNAEWRDRANSRDMVEGDTFVKGNEYILYAYVDVQEGYAWPSDVQHEVAATVNGQTALIVDVYGKKYKCVQYVFTCVETLTIADVALTGVTAPVDGKTPQFDFSPATPGIVKAADSKWWNVTDSQWVTASDVFEEGKDYTFYAFVDVLSGYVWPSDVQSNVTATMNENAADIMDAYEKSYKSVSYTFTCAPNTDIKKIEITHDDIAPVGGEKAGDHMTFTLPTDALYSCEICRWYDDTADEYMVDNEVFSESHLYSLSFVVTTDEGYAFAPDATITINGADYLLDAVATSFMDETMVYIWTKSMQATAVSGDGWYLDGAGVLHLTGKIENTSKEGDATPWASYKGRICAVVAEEGASLTNGAYLFSGCSSLVFVDLANLKTGGMTSTKYMFYGCRALEALDVSGLNTSTVTNMSFMFAGCKNVTDLNIDGFDTTYVVNMESLFFGCSSLTALDVSEFNNQNAQNMNHIFGGCSNLSSLTLGKFVTAKATDLSGMFADCGKLTALDVSGFNTAGVTNMYALFQNCAGLTEIDLSGFVTDKVTDMSSLFEGCSGLAALNIRAFDTANVKYFGNMFAGCSGLTALDVSAMNTASAQSMDGMFTDCSALTALDLRHFDTASVTGSMTAMFSGCAALEDLGVNHGILAKTAAQLLTLSPVWTDVTTGTIFSDETALKAAETVMLKKGVHEKETDPTGTSTETEPTVTEVEPTATKAPTATEVEPTVTEPKPTETKAPTATEPKATTEPTAKPTVAPTEVEPTATEAKPTASKATVAPTEIEPTTTEEEPTATEPVIEPTATATGTEAPSFILYGDANDDGVVNMKDVLAVRKFIAGLSSSINELTADANADGVVNMKDVLAIRKYIAGLVDHLGA